MRGAFGTSHFIFMIFFDPTVHENSLKWRKFKKLSTVFFDKNDCLADNKLMFFTK